MARVTFVDAAGGALAALAAAVARASGVDASAVTISDRVDVPADVTECLAEIRLRAPDVQRAAVAGDRLAGASGRDAHSVFLGPAPAPIADAALWAIDLRGPQQPATANDDGLPSAFERMTWLRRHRDALERRVEQEFAPKR